MRINVFYVRHGLSCANIAQKFALPGTFAIYRDPELTNLGREFSKRNGEAFRAWLEANNHDIDMVASSAMIRAIETAKLMFPSVKTTLVLPHIVEHGVTPDNRPLPVIKQLPILDRTFEEVDCKPTCLKVHAKAATGQPGRNSSNLNKFEQFLAKLLASHHGRPRNIVVVTHSSFLKRYLGLSEKPPNNGAIHVTYEWSKSEPSLARKAIQMVPYPIDIEYPQNKQGHCPDGCRKRMVCSRRQRLLLGSAAVAGAAGIGLGARTLSKRKRRKSKA